MAPAVSMLKEDLIQFEAGETIFEPITSERKEAQCIEGVQVIGQLDRTAGSFVPNKTAIRLSQFDYKSLPIPETEDGPAHLAPFEKDGVRISPLRIALEKFGKQYRVPEAPDPLRVSDCLPRNFNPKNVKPVSIEEAIYGIPGYMKSVDFDASAGYFYKKRGLTRRMLCFDEKGNQRIHPLLRENVERIIHAAKKRIIIPAVFEETLKDEVRSKEKNDDAQTRLFSAGDFDSFVAQRMYLGTFFVEFTKDPTGSCIGLGINPHSQQWGRLFSRLRGLADENRFCGAGDFKNYDISLKNQMLRLFLKLVKVFYEGDDAIVVVVLIKSNFQGWHVVGVIVFLRPWGTCSGSFITSMFNSFSNWVLHKIAFIHIYSEEEWKVVETTFTGDDSVFSAPESYKEYNMAYLSRFFRDFYGMEYTSPLKTGDMNMTWDDLVYLKRKFEPGHFGIMAPLAQRSLANMIKWTDTEQTVEIMQSVLNSLLQESWHYGEEFYGSIHAWARKESRRLGKPFDLPDFKAMNRMRQPDYLFA
jgi:hypothetical protein